MHPYTKKLSYRKDDSIDLTTIRSKEMPPRSTY